MKMHCVDRVSSPSCRKFVKEQKQVHEEISRMSFKAMLKVQDDIKSLKQLLSVSASGLQRNALAIGHLKMEAALVHTELTLSFEEFRIKTKLP